STLELGIVVAAAPGVPATLTLESLRADDRSGPRGWFGLPGELTLGFTLRNPGTEDVTDPPFTLLVGPPGRARTIVAAPAVGTVAAGATRDYRVTVPTGAAVLTAALLLARRGRRAPAR
ncbi:hypothetical protein AB0C00_30460, partial [Micromonospora carbonacea]